MSKWRLRWWRFEGRMMAIYYWLLGRTIRFRFEGEEHLVAARATGRPVIWAVWHGMQMPYFVFGITYLKPANFLVVAVGDERYHLLAAMADSLGAATVRVDMGGNPMAAGRAVLNVIRSLKQGKTTFMHPDGPDGPPFQPKPGVFFMARKAKALVMPIGLWSRQGLEMRRWDRFLFLPPFARLHVVMGDPIDVADHPEPGSLESAVTAALNKCRWRAQALAGRRQWPQPPVA